MVVKLLLEELKMALYQTHLILRDARASSLNDLINRKLQVLGLGLILSCGGASDENISGCKNDSECKGNRYCIDGECVEGGGNGGKDSYTSGGDTSSGCQDECTAGEKKCVGLKIMECVSKEGCAYWELVKECGLDEYCTEDFQCGCNPEKYTNACDGLVLTYCEETISNKKGVVKTLNCEDKGMSHCNYSEFYDNRLCFGEGKLGEGCSHDLDHGLVSCNLYETTWCDYHSECALGCEEDEDCPDGYHCEHPMDSPIFICAPNN